MLETMGPSERTRSAQWRSESEPRSIQTGGSPFNPGLTRSEGPDKTAVSELGCANLYYRVVYRHAAQVRRVSRL
jgi:hypothetical protein